MGIAYNTSIVPDGLIFAVDPANTRCYSGTGTSVASLISGMGGTLFNGASYSTATVSYTHLTLPTKRIV